MSGYGIPVQDISCWHWAAGEQRERKGRCVAGLVLTSEQPSPAAGPADKPAWLYRFQRAPGTVQPSARASSTMQDSCLVEGDIVILSVEGSLRIQATLLLHSDSTRLRKIWLIFSNPANLWKGIMSEL